MEKLIETIPIIRFNKLRGSVAWNGECEFNNVSYGDAEYTLVQPSDLANEIEHWLEIHPYECAALTMVLSQLVKDLRGIPGNVLVALDG